MMPKDTTADIAKTAEYINLHRLFMLRNIAIMGQLVAVYVTQIYLHIPLPVLSISLVIFTLALFNLFTIFRLRWGGKVTQLEFLLQLLVDVLVLTALLYLTGGATNPFVLMFLLPVIIATAVLSPRYTWVITLVTALCYSLLMWKYTPLPMEHHSDNGFSQHVLGMWVSFVVSAAVTAYFVVAMRRTLQSKQHELNAAREKQLRDEQLVVLGTLAASTAHEMGTPLGTMHLLSDELKETVDDPAAQAIITTLKEQVTRCKDALANLSSAAGSVQLGGGNIVAVDDFLHEVLNEWQQSRPTAQIDTDWQGNKPAPGILADRTLSQALCNILDNAADASSDDVQWLANWDTNCLTMEINDRGNGLSSDAEQIVGNRPYSEKGDGMGLGLFLADSIINRFGGDVRLANRDGGGVTTRIHLPLTDG